MRNFAVVVSLVLVVFLGLGEAAAQEAPQQLQEEQKEQPPEIAEGTYLCQGLSHDDKPYVGRVEVKKGVEGTYLLRWRLVGGDEMYGIGILRGNILSVSLMGSGIGVAIYQFIDSNTLIGEYSLLGVQGTRPEVIQKVNEEDLPPVEEPVRPAPKPTPDSKTLIA